MNTQINLPKKYKIGFLENKLTVRGTSKALYDYADLNETLLGNTSVIITRRPQENWSTTLQTYNKFAKRFGIIYYTDPGDIHKIVEKERLDILYIIKSGDKNDRLFTDKCKCVIHCTFNLSDPHGNVYAGVSPFLNKLYNTDYPVVPHLIKVHNTRENLRKDLNISDDAIVISGTGGSDSFNINFVQEFVANYHLGMEKKNDVYFLFMNIDKFCDSPNVIFLEGTSDEEFKRKFINTADVLLHARERGETFGLVCGEFAVCGKPVITYGGSYENNHIQMLGQNAFIYNNKYELMNIINKFLNREINYLQIKSYQTIYHKHTSPEYVMDEFNKVFIQS